MKCFRKRSFSFHNGLEIEDFLKTKRRVNGLEFNIIPELQKAESFVRLSLEEQERDDTIRLKKLYEIFKNL